MDWWVSWNEIDNVQDQISFSLWTSSQRPSSGDIIDVAFVVKSCQEYTAAMFLGEQGGDWGRLEESVVQLEHATLAKTELLHPKNAGA